MAGPYRQRLAKATAIGRETMEIRSFSRIDTAPGDPI
jgi:hypothetical protein